MLLTGSISATGSIYTGGNMGTAMSSIYNSSNNIIYLQNSVNGIQPAGTNTVNSGSIVLTNTGGTGAYSIMSHGGSTAGFGFYIQSQDRTAAAYYPILLNPNGGTIGVNTTNISTECNLHLGAQGSAEGGQLVLQKGTSYASASHLDNYQNRFRVMSGTDTASSTERFSIDMTNGAVTTAGPVYRYSGQTVVGGSFTSLTALDMSSSRTYLIQMIPTNTEAGLSYRIFGLIQANATSGTYVFSTIHSQTMDITFSGTTVQARVTNSQQWTFNWSIIQLL
jgi:hypothetical protein